ncbi:hypothetical protein HD593_005002 [Nonomuraea rubra]|uniref:Uncharacterized protein n=1 Tax=Nonomuraea rubra TaxID=46180 RepID=A0A7X0NV99_9ACTN|nr:hypothetical protein [Nonomuraea rubra]
MVGVGAVQVEHDPFGVGPARELAQVDLAGGLQGRQTPGEPILGGVEDEPVRAAVLVQDPGDAGAGEDRAVAGDDDVGLQGLQPVDRGEGPVHRAHEDQRGESGEHQIAGEQHALFGQPGDQISGGVRRAAGVQQLDPPTCDVQSECGAGRDVGKPAGHRPPVRDRVPQRWAAVDDRVGLKPFPHPAVPDDHCRGGEEAVAVGVVTVLMGVHRQPDGRPAGGRVHGVEKPAGASRGGAGVDHQDPRPSRWRRGGDRAVRTWRNAWQSSGSG